MGKSDGLTELLHIPNSARVVNIKDPGPGMWSIKVNSLSLPGGRSAFLTLLKMNDAVTCEFVRIQFNVHVVKHFIIIHQISH